MGVVLDKLFWVDPDSELGSTAVEEIEDERGDAVDLMAPDEMSLDI
jgi:hypothetical protein